MAITASHRSQIVSVSPIEAPLVEGRKLPEQAQSPSSVSKQNELKPISPMSMSNTCECLAMAERLPEKRSNARNGGKADSSQCPDWGSDRLRVLFSAFLDELDQGVLNGINGIS